MVRLTHLGERGDTFLLHQGRLLLHITIAGLQGGVELRGTPARPAVVHGVVEVILVLVTVEYPYHPLAGGSVCGGGVLGVSGGVLRCY